MPFAKGDPRINRNGRPKTGQSFAEKVRAVVGQDGHRLVDFFAAVAWGRMPKDDGTSSNALYVTALRTAASKAEISDRIHCAKVLADRGFGKPKEDNTVSGNLTISWKQ